MCDVKTYGSLIALRAVALLITAIIQPENVRRDQEHLSLYAPHLYEYNLAVLTDLH